MIEREMDAPFFGASVLFAKWKLIGFAQVRRKQLTVAEIFQ